MLAQVGGSKYIDIEKGMGGYSGGSAKPMQVT